MLNTALKFYPILAQPDPEIAQRHFIAKETKERVCRLNTRTR